MTIELLYDAQQAILWGGLLLMWVVETLTPRERRSLKVRAQHGLHNALVWVASIVVLSLVFGAGFGQAIVWLDAHRVGLLHAFDMPLWVRVVLAFLLLDFSGYVLHRLSHRWRALWVLHCVHHSDPDLDVTTNLRHHPLHVVCTIAWKVIAVAAIGPPVLVLLVYEAVTMAVAHVHHAGIRWPAWVDGATSWLIVSPRAHWIHHSTVREQTDANFGSVLSWWDRLAGTYVRVPHDTPRFGLLGLSAPRDGTVVGMLWTPVRAWRAREL